MKLKLERKLEYINRFCYEARDLKWEMETGNKVLEKLDEHIEIIYPNRFEEKISEGGNFDPNCFVSPDSSELYCRIS